MTKPRYALTPAFRGALIDCRAKGMSILECSARIGFTTEVIRRWLHELGLPLRLNHGRTPGTRVALKEPRHDHQ